MSLFTAGEVVSASELRDALGAMSVLLNDISIVSSATSVDVPGLAVQLDGYSRYAIDGYIAYNAGIDPEARFGLTAPPEAAGTWTIAGVPDGTNANTGDLIAVRRDAFNVGTALTTEHGIGGAGSITAATLVGRIRTYRFGGVLVLRSAQLYSNAVATTVNAGSWIRAQKIGSTL